MVEKWGLCTGRRIQVTVSNSSYFKTWGFNLFTLWLYQKLYVKYAVKTIIEKSFCGPLSVQSNMAMNSQLPEAVNMNQSPVQGDDDNQTPIKPKV